MIDAINSWIKNGCNYQRGVGLYNQYGTNKFLKLIFKSGETATNRQKLNTELVGLRDGAPSKSPPVGETLTIKGQVNNKPVDLPNPAINKVLPTGEDLGGAKKPELLLVIEQRQKTYDEIRALKPLLVSTDDGEDLRLLAERLVRLGKKNAELWVRYNYLTEHPDEVEEHEPVKVPVMVDLNLLQERERIRKSLNKAENRIKGQAKPKQNTLDLIAEKRQQLADIDAQIKRIKDGGAQ